MKAIIIIFSEDRDLGIFYLSTKFEHDRSTNIGYLLSDRKKGNTHKHLPKQQQHTKSKITLVRIPFKQLHSLIHLDSMGVL